MAEPKYQKLNGDSQTESVHSDNRLDGEFPIHTDDIRLANKIKQIRRRWFSFMIATNAIVFVAFIVLTWWPLKPHFPRDHKAQLSIAEWRNGTYSPSINSIEWLPHGVKGEFIQDFGDKFAYAEFLHANSTSKIIAPAQFKDADQHDRYVDKVILNADKSKVILKTDTEKNWRHSTYAFYWVHDVESKETFPLSESPLSLAKWNSKGDQIVFVEKRNVYLFDVPSKKTTQITFDGGDDVFNGLPDWVYEEEVFSGDSAVWWSSSSRFLSYMRTNDSLVPKFPIPYFVSPNNKTAQYPHLTNLKYPKPGFPNPQVEYWIFDTSSEQTNRVSIPTELVDPIISEVIWVGEESVVKISDRVSDHLEVWVINPAKNEIVKTRSYSSEDLHGAWFEVTHNSQAVGDRGYIDTIDVNGYNHLAYFSPASSSTPQILTSGEWEVSDLTMGINLETNHVYFHASKLSSIDEQLYRVSLDTHDPITDPEPIADKGPGIYSAKFSGDCSFATVLYTAPDAPITQFVVKLSKDITKQHQWPRSNSTELTQLLNDRGLIKYKNEPLIQFGEIEVNGVKINYREIRPSRFNPKHKHPLLFFNYGGPISQTVKHAYTIDFQNIFAEQHNAVIVTIDPRGTAKRGRKFRQNVRDHMGENEADDVIAAAKQWVQKKYIDEQKTAIWGWSFGGFLTLKTLERDTDLVFKYGVAVAPVTDWQLYDSIYTERYMHSPQTNAEGYAKSKITDVKWLGKHERTLIMHGTGDDNVHFQNSLLLLDELNLADVENVDVHVFPDSDHSIRFHNAQTIVFDKILSWLGQFF